MSTTISIQPVPQDTSKSCIDGASNAINKTDQKIKQITDQKMAQIMVCSIGGGTLFALYTVNYLSCIYPMTFEEILIAAYLTFATFAMVALVLTSFVVGIFHQGFAARDEHIAALENSKSKRSS